MLGFSLLSLLKISLVLNQVLLENLDLNYNVVK